MFKLLATLAAFAKADEAAEQLKLAAADVHLHDNYYVITDF